MTTIFWICLGLGIAATLVGAAALLKSYLEDHTDWIE